MELLTVQETARILKVAPITIRRFIAEGRLAAVKVGKGIRVRKEAVEQFATPVESKAPSAARARRAGRTLTYDDPLWKLVGAASDARPTDASKKHEYLADFLTGERTP